MEQEADLPAFADIFKSKSDAVIFIGAANVGKTALVYRYILDELPERISATVALEFTKRNIELGPSPLQLHIWDTAGQERFKAVTKHHYRGADACLAVFDLSDRSSFDALPNWLTELRENVDPNCVLYILGNKADIPRKVSRDEAIAYSQSQNASYFETSSLWTRATPLSTDQQSGGIENIFLMLVSDLVKAHSANPQMDSQTGSRLGPRFCAPDDKCLC